MTFKMEHTMSNVLPELFQPFWYGTFSGLWIYYRVDIDTAQAILDEYTMTEKGPGFTAFEFTDKDGSFALANINFMCYGAQSGSNDPRAYTQILQPPPDGPPSAPANIPPGFGVEGASEVELSIISYPTARKAQAPDQGFSAADFLAGNDHTKTLGPFRLMVPCDDRVAVYWGSWNFGENKFMTYPFVYNVPSPNNDPKVTGWDFTVPGAVGEPGYSYDPVTKACTPFIMRASIDVSRHVPATGNPSEILDYSMLKDPEKKGKMRPIGSRRNIFGIFSTYVFHGSTPPRSYSYETGNSSHPMVALLGKLLGSEPAPFAAQVFQSPPVIAESGTYYVDL